MRDAPLHVVAILPDGREYFCELYKSSISQKYDFQSAADQAVRKYNLRTPRSNPTTIKIKVCTLTIKDGALARDFGYTYDTQLLLERMTESEFGIEMNSELDKIPEEFVSYVSQTAWDNHHSSGYEDVLQSAKEIISNLLPCIKAYSHRIKMGR